MPLFGKRKKDADVSELDADVTGFEFDSEPEDGGDRRRKKKKKRDMMSSILSESVVESSLEDFRNNKSMCCMRDGMPCYVGILLRADDIGGISRRANRDEQKGSMVEAINSGGIRTLITHEMLEDEELVIIPDLDTVLRMDEFGILSQAPYTLVFVDDMGNVDKTGIEVTFDEIANVVSDAEKIDDFLARKGVPWANGVADIPHFESSSRVSEVDSQPESAPASKPFGYEDKKNSNDISMPAHMAYEPEEEIPLYEGDDDVSVGGASGDDDFDIFDDDVDDIPVDPRQADLFTGRAVVVDEPDDENNLADDAQRLGVDEVVSADQVQAALSRRFYSEDLGLEVSVEPFEAYFARENPIAYFDEDRGDGWMNNYLAQMSKQANSELSNMHEQHMFSLRERYLTLMGMHCENILRDLDLQDPSTRFGAAQEALTDRKESRLANIVDEVDVKMRALDREWERKLQAEADAAAMAARKAYMDSHERLHDRQIMRIEPDIRMDIEDQYNDGVRDLQERRRNEASRRLDLCVTDTLREVADLFVRMMNEEQDLRQNWSDSMAMFVEENRKDDIARVNALSAELAQSEKVESTVAEFNERMEAMRAEFRSRSEIQAQALDETQRANADALARVKSDANRREAELLQQIETLQDSNDSLMRQLRDMDEAKSREWRKKLDESEEAHTREIERYDSMMGDYKKVNLVQVALTIIAVIAALAIGAIVGLTVNVSSRTDSDRIAIQQQLDERLTQSSNTATGVQ